MELTEELIIEMAKEETNSICNCIYLHAAGDNHDEWFDCIHPNKPSNQCPYRKMKECNLAEADKEAQELYIKMSVDSFHFWEEYKKNDDMRLHICDIPMDQLRSKHKHVLELIPEYGSQMIGTLITGKYYKDVWSSRSCSGTLATMVNGTDYMDFYCGSSDYYCISYKGNPFLAKFESADALDRAEDVNRSPF